jgi:hypothetical protein
MKGKEGSVLSLNWHGSVSRGHRGVLHVRKASHLTYIHVHTIHCFHVYMREKCTTDFNRNWTSVENISNTKRVKELMEIISIISRV